MQSPQNMPAAPAEPTPDDSWADFIADTVTTMKPVSTDVLRAVQVCDALENFGANLRKPCGSRHVLSYPTTKIRTFWSHSWHGRAWKKYATLLLFYHGSCSVLV
ncbi:ABCC12 [Symbiodinium sp. CCMP2456]|nr:ABCC12 [Symbiodinium sp. CCMP2456]